MPPLAHTVQKILSDGAIRDEVVALYQGNLGDIGSPGVHEKLKSWAQAMQKIAQSSAKGLKLADLVELDKFPATVKEIETSGEKTGLSSRLISEFNTLGESIRKRVEGSQEMALLTMVRDFGRSNHEKAEKLMDVMGQLKTWCLDEKHMPNGMNDVGKCMEAIGKYMETLASLDPANGSAPAFGPMHRFGATPYHPWDVSANYSPHLDRMLAEVGRANSPLHDSNNIFGWARRICSTYADKPFNDPDFVPMVAEAQALEKHAQLVAREAGKIRSLIQI